VRASCSKEKEAFASMADGSAAVRESNWRGITDSITLAVILDAAQMPSTGCFG